MKFGLDLRWIQHGALNFLAHQLSMALAEPVDVGCDSWHADAKGARRLLVGNHRTAAATGAAQKTLQYLKGFALPLCSLLLLQALRGAAQKQKRPLRVVKRFRSEPVFRFENEARLRIPPI